MELIEKSSDIDPEKRIMCCAWGLVKPETIEDEQPRSSSSFMVTIRSKPKEFVVCGGAEPQLKIVHISPTDAHVYPYEYTLKMPGMGVHCVEVSPDNKSIAAIAVDGNLTLLDVKDGVRLPNVGHRLVSNFWSTTFGAPSGSVYAGSGNGEIFKYDTTLGRLLHSYDTERCGNILGLAVTADQRILGATDCDGNVTLIDGATGKLMRRGNFQLPLRKLVFDPNTRYALAACDDKTIKVFDLPSGQLRQSLKAHDSIVMSVAVSPDGQRFVSGSCDGTIQVWDSRTTKKTLSFTCGSNKHLWDVAFNRLSNKISFVGDGKGLSIYYCLGNVFNVYL